MKCLRALFLLFACTYVQADELMIHGLTVHGHSTYRESSTAYIRPDGTVDHVVEHRRKFNGVNPGLTYTWADGEQIGFFKNSYYRWSVHASYRHMFNDHVGAFGGFATGYSDRAGKGLIGGFALRTPAYSGWRAVLIAQPFGGKSSAYSLALSQAF